MDDDNDGERGWLMCLRRTNIHLLSCFLLERMFNLRIFQSLSLLTFYPLSSSKTCMNKSNSPSSSRRDLLGRGPQQNHKIPRKISQFFHHLDTFGRKVNTVIKSLTPFCCVLSWSENWAKFYYSQSISKVSTWNKFGEKLIQCQAELKWLREIEVEGGKAWGKVVDGRYNASLKSGKHGRKYWAAEEEKKYREKRRRNILDAEFEITPAWLPPTNGFCAIKWYPGHYFLGQDCFTISYIFIIFEIIIFSLGLEAVTEAICHTGHLLDKVVYFRHVIGNLSCIDLPLLWFLFLHVCNLLLILELFSSFIRFLKP